MTVITRRQFATALGGAAAVWPLAGNAQQAMSEIGFLRDGTEASSEEFVAGLRKGLSDAGYVEGRNITIDYAWSDGQSDRLPALAAKLVLRHPRVIVSSAINATIAAKAATSTIPIVFAIPNDPASFGLVASINRPGGNVTGVSYLTSDLGGKRLGLIHEILPNVTDFAVLASRNTPAAALFISDTEAAARKAGLRIEVFTAAREVEIDTAFEELTARGLGALLVVNSVLFTMHREHIVALAARHKVPAIYTPREYADVGGLISYGTNLPEVYRLVGRYAARILKGDKTEDLPVLLPTMFEMVVNLRTARTLGLTIPLTVLATADEVIE